MPKGLKVKVFIKISDNSATSGLPATPCSVSFLNQDLLFARAAVIPRQPFSSRSEHVVLVMGLVRHLALHSL